MKTLHTPNVNARYWAAITLASVFGTNLGDLYAHTTHLGLVPGIALLAVLAAGAFAAERLDDVAHTAWYWLVIIIIRTGATNIADFLAFKMRVPLPLLIGGLAALLGMLAWRSRIAGGAASMLSRCLPTTDATYWIAMLVAGVFGTALGDVCSHLVGQGAAALALGLALGLVLAWWGTAPLAAGIGAYWLIVAIARTAGTAIGDWLAENRIVDIGLPASTVLTGCAFVAVAAAWPRRREVRLP